MQKINLATFRKPQHSSSILKLEQGRQEEEKSNSFERLNYVN